MKVIGDLIWLLGQAQPATPTPEQVEVTLLDEGKAWWRDFVVPAATLTAALVGGIGGVVIGGRMNRTTMRAVEAERAEKERQLEAAKSQRELTAERRLAIGSLRLLIDELQRALSTLELERGSEGDDPLISSVIDTHVHVRPEDKHAIAMWVSDNLWKTISVTVQRVELLNILRSQHQAILDQGERIEADEYRADAAVAVALVRETLGILDHELRRLEAQ